MQVNEGITPLRLRNKRLDAVKDLNNSPCLKIPASPFMKHLGYGTGVNVYLIERSPKYGQYRSPWAVKKISKKCCHSSLYEERLVEEAEILRRLHHKNIVGFRSFTRSADGTICLAMEDGGRSLMSMIEDRLETGLGPFPARTILHIAAQIADGLTYLHNQKRLLHGDLKSSNILVWGECEDVKICDFGVTMALDDRLVATNAHAHYVGTESWSCKEAVRGGQISDKADIFAFGMILYEMLTLAIPHMHVFPEEEDYEDQQLFEKDFARAEMEYEESLGTRPPLVNYEYDVSYSPVIELFWACTQELAEDRPSSADIATSFRKQLDFNFAFSAPDPKAKLEF